MKVPVNWLRELVPFTISVKALAERLSVSGLEVEGLDELSDGDRVIDVDILPNMARCMAVVGMAREVSALTDTPLLAEPALAELPSGTALAPTVEAPELCSRIALLHIDGVDDRLAPEWVVGRLAAAGVDSVSGLVDIGNYVMIELGQPLHVYDAGALDGLELRVRGARDGESLELLSRQAGAPPVLLQAGVPVIADTRDVPVAVAGVVGGRPTAVSSATTSVLVEAASFDFLAIRRSQTALGLVTEASSRFSRGVDPELSERGLRRFAKLVREIHPECVLVGYGDTRTAPPSERRITLDVDQLNAVIGAEYPVEVVESVFARLGLVHRRDGRVVTVTVGDERADLRIPHDLMEEVVRVHGLDFIQATMPQTALPVPRRDTAREGHTAIRASLVRAGLTETISYTLSSPEVHAAVGGPADGQLLALLNPLSAELRVVRRSLMPGLLQTVKSNLRHTSSVHVFEHGVVVEPEHDGTDPGLPREVQHVAVAMVGDADPDSMWLHEGRPVDVYDVADAVLGVFDDLHVQDVRLRPADLPPFRRSACAAVLHEDRVLGHLGILHDDVARAFGLTDRQVLLAELDADAIASLRRTEYPTVMPSRFPSARLDVSVAVAGDLPTGDLLEIADLPELVSVAVFDVFSGKNLPGNRKAVGLRLTINGSDRTLTTREAEEVRDRFVDQLVRRFGAEVR